MTEQYRVNAPAVIHQTIDRETVIIHLERGLYYSLDETGAGIWQDLAAGRAAGKLTEQLVARFPDQGTEVAHDVREFIEGLLREDLLVAVEEGAADDGAPEPAVDAGAGSGNPATSPAPASGARWVPPRVERFEDLQDLLLLDPIHAVDETGWPQRLQVP